MKICLAKSRVKLSTIICTQKHRNGLSIVEIFRMNNQKDHRVAENRTFSLINIKEEKLHLVKWNHHIRFFDVNKVFKSILSIKFPPSFSWENLAKFRKLWMAEHNFDVADESVQLRTFMRHGHVRRVRRRGTEG